MKGILWHGARQNEGMEVKDSDPWSLTPDSYFFRTFIMRTELPRRL